MIGPKRNRGRSEELHDKNLQQLLRFEGYEVESEVKRDFDFLDNEDPEGLVGLIVHGNPFEISNVVENLENAKKRFPKTCIVITTGYCGNGEFNKYFINEGYYILTQPYEPEELYKALKDFRNREI